MHLCLGDFRSEGFDAEGFIELIAAARRLPWAIEDFSSDEDLSLGTPALGWRGF